MARTIYKLDCKAKLAPQAQLVACSGLPTRVESRFLATDLMDIVDVGIVWP